jgi:hypothetical protein
MEVLGFARDQALDLELHTANSIPCRVSHPSNCWNLVRASPKLQDAPIAMSDVANSAMSLIIDSSIRALVNQYYVELSSPHAPAYGVNRYRHMCSTSLFLSHLIRLYQISPPSSSTSYRRTQAWLSKPFPPAVVRPLFSKLAKKSR